MSEDLNFVEVEKVDVNGLQVYQHEKAQIDMQISTARAYPRNLEMSIKNAISIIKLDKEIAESCVYTLMKGGKKIEGPSVNLAKIIAQEMGNMRIENRVLGYDSTHVTCEAICFDLEKNFAIRTTIKKSIVGNRGRYSEDLCVIVGNAGNSIALRNAIFAVISKPIINKLYKTAKDFIIGGSSKQNIDERKKQVFDSFIKKYSDKSLSKEDLIKYCNKETYEDIDSDDIISLIGLANSLVSMETTFEDAFRSNNYKGEYDLQSKEEKESKRLLDLINMCTSKEELSKYTSLLSNQEQRDSYDKMWKKLK